jgi:hypothetical protein
MSRAAYLLDKIKEEFDIEEKSARRSISFRGGTRHIRYRCPPGYKRVNRTCQRIPASIRVQRSRALKKAWRSKRRGKQVRLKISRQRTFRRMRAAGYNPGGGRRQ